MNLFVLTLHILGAGFLVAVFTFAILFILKKPFSEEKLSNIRTVINVGAVGFVYQIITGALLFSEHASDFKTSVLFWVKIGLFIIDILVGLVLVNRKLRAMEKGDSEKVVTPKTLAAWLVANLLLTLVIIVVSIIVAK